eukprot:756930-Hanusia_phi.AAC.1
MSREKEKKGNMDEKGQGSRVTSEPEVDRGGGKKEEKAKEREGEERGVERRRRSLTLFADFDERAILHLQSSAPRLIHPFISPSFLPPSLRSFLLPCSPPTLLASPDFTSPSSVRFFERGNALFSRLEEALQVCKGPHVAPLLFSAAAGPADEDRAAGRKEQGGRLYHASLRSCVVTPLPVANLEDELKRRSRR